METITTPNPLLEQEDFFKQYNENIEKLKNNPQAIEFDKLCYEVFEAHPMGKKFIEFATDRFIIGSQVARNSPTYQIDVLWQEGFRDAYRMIMNHVMSHKQRIAAGK